MSMLPKESLSKETDSYLLAVIGYPAFAVESRDIIERTEDEIINKLGGRYGFKRFLRDGHKTPLEDPHRLHYESWELRVFETIECQWPIFFCYLLINGAFKGEDATKYADLLDEVLIKNQKGLRLVPELYAIPNDKLWAERQNPGSQIRTVRGNCPFLWAQSLYIIAQLLEEKFIMCGEIDPMNRRLCLLNKPDVIVQVVVLSKDKRIQDILKENDIYTKTLDEVSPYEVHPARVLSYLFRFLGRNEKLGLKGRKSRDVGILMTSKLYKINDKIFVFTPQRFDLSRNYMDCDTSLMMTTLEYGLNYLSTSWASLGKPLMTLILGENILENGELPDSVLSTLRKISRGGYINGTRVKMGNFEDFISTSCITNLSFIGCYEDGCHERLEAGVEKCLAEHEAHSVVLCRSLLKSKLDPYDRGTRKRRLSMKGSVKRSRTSINLDNRESLFNPNAFRGRLDSLYPEEYLENSSSSSMMLPIVVTTPPPLLPLTAEAELSSDFQLSVSLSRQRQISESNFAHHEVNELLAILTTSETLGEQGDILHSLATTYGLDYNTQIEQNGKTVTIKDLLSSLYESAVVKRSWGMVRHSAGLLGKRVEDLSKSVTDVLVREKHVTVGLPPEDEITISRPLSSQELRSLINKAFRGDASTAMLCQELLVYLGMFINTEPKFFHGIMRLRIGLIIQVMATEIGNSLRLQEDDAYEELMNLSPYEVRNLLRHILSSTEFDIEKKESGYGVVTADEVHLSKALLKQSKDHYVRSNQANDNNVDNGNYDEDDEAMEEDEEYIADEADEPGSWVRRRRLDGALNRVPIGFYSRIWHVLQICRELRIGDKAISSSLTQEMTSGEMKFALVVESVLNSVPRPEFRQLLVEALMVLTLAQEHRVVPMLGDSIDIENIVYTAGGLFLQDQYRIKGDSSICCAKTPECDVPRGVSVKLPCGGTAGICRNFYDSAPSGPYGTMSYLIKAACLCLENIPKDGIIECNIM